MELQYNANDDVMGHVHVPELSRTCPILSTVHACSLVPRLHSPAFYRTYTQCDKKLGSAWSLGTHSAIKSWGVESGNEATCIMSLVVLGNSLDSVGTCAIGCMQNSATARSTATAGTCPRNKCDGVLGRS